MKKKSWHIKEFKKFILKNKREFFISMFIMLLTITWYFFTDNSFNIKTYEPISDPIFTLRMLSGLTFLSLGNLLFRTRFYQFFNYLLDKKTFNELKALVWHILMFVVGFIILPFIIDVANYILSFLLNIFNFILWFFPLIGIPLLVFLGLKFLKKIR